MIMNAKKKKVKSGKITLKAVDKLTESVNEKKHIGKKPLPSKSLTVKKSGKRQKELGAKDYCEACLRIRTGSRNSSEASQECFIPHTCRKTRQELNEFIYHMNIFYVMRRRGISEGEYNNVCGDY